MDLLVYVTLSRSSHLIQIYSEAILPPPHVVASSPKPCIQTARDTLNAKIVLEVVKPIDRNHILNIVFLFSYLFSKLHEIYYCERLKRLFFNGMDTSNVKDLIVI